MKLDQSLNNLHRHFNRLWIDNSELTKTLSYNEYEYLRSVDKLDGQKVSKASEDDIDGTHLSDLAIEMKVQKASASVMMKKLEKRGLIQRFQCRHDARAQHILLTDDGRSILEQGAKLYDQLSAKMQASLEPEEIQNLERILSKVNQAL